MVSSLGPWKGEDFIPSPFEVGDEISIQKVGREMAAFIGMNDLLFIIYRAKQKQGVGGNIELNHSDQAVFIEIDTEFGVKESVLAVLAHELAHKFLHRRSISLPGVQDNEELTDLATIFMGFGSLSLNGCYTTQTQTKWLGGTTTQTSEKEWKVGYISPSDFALAYLIHGLSAGRTPEQLKRRLLHEALAQFQIAESNHAWIRAFDQGNLSRKFSDGNIYYQNQLLVLASLAQALRARISDSLKKYHTRMLSLGPQCEALMQDSKPTLIRSLAIRQEALACEAELLEEQYSLRCIFDTLDWRALESSGLAREEKIQISCPRCTSELRTRNQSSIKTLRCPKCTMTFDFSGPLDFLESKKQGDAEEQNRGKGWLRRITGRR